MENLKYKKEINNIIIILLGTLIFAIGIEWFAKPNNIVTGGATGFSIVLTTIIKKLTHIDIPISFIVFLINIPIFILSYVVSGSKLIKKSILSTAMTCVWLDIIHKMPCLFKIENDLFLSTILTGVVCGTGTGLMLKIDAPSGGTDMLSNSINKLIPKFELSKIIFTIDAAIVLFGLFIFGPKKTAYSIIEIFICSRIINNMLGGLRFKRAVFIVTEKAQEISQSIFEQLKRGNTNLKCTGMYTKQEKNLLIVVVKPKEIVKLKKIIESKDEKAFVVIYPAQEVLGNFAD